MSDEEKEVLQIMYESYLESGNNSVTMTLHSKPVLESLERRGLVENGLPMLMGIISTITTDGIARAKSL